MENILIGYASHNSSYSGFLLKILYSSTLKIPQNYNKVEYYIILASHNFSQILITISIKHIFYLSCLLSNSIIIYTII